MPLSPTRLTPRDLRLVAVAAERRHDRREHRHHQSHNEPAHVEMDGYFSCKKGETNYKVRFVHHADPDSGWDMLPMCESVRYNMYIGPEGRLAPCMGFSDTAIGPKFPSVLEEPLGKLTLEDSYYDVVNTRISDFLAKNPENAECEHLTRCCGGCMVQGITDDGDYLVPDSRIC